MESNKECRTEWIKSPLTDKTERLEIYRELDVKPFLGNRRKKQLRHTSYVIGSGADADWNLRDPFVSSKHARLYLDQSGGYVIEDLGSKNGIFLNGVKVFKARLPMAGQLRVGRTILDWNETAGQAPDLPTGWVSEDESMLALLASLRQVARSRLSILILGETGSGKEGIASLVHQWSERHSRRLVALNAGQMGGSLVDSELFGHQRGAFTGAESSRMGALLAADGGTLYLDEVADIPMATQIRLLRALDSGEVKALGSDRAQHVDARLVSATSQDITALVEGGAFRLDFYYRIAGHVLRIPPLRERPKDIRAIATAYLKAKRMELDAEALARLLSYSWPGNVREMRHTLERALILARACSHSHILPGHIEFMGLGQETLAPEQEQARTLEEIEVDAIKRALERSGWSRSHVAKELGIARSTLFEKMRRYKLRDASSIQ